MKKIYLLLAGLLLVSSAFSQSDSTRVASSPINIAGIFAPPSPVKFSGYVDAYYSYNFNTPVQDVNSYYYNYHRHNEYTTNFAMLKAEYNKDRVKANFGLMSGTYVETNLAAEPNALRNIYEANVGYKLNRHWWITAGIMESHLGFESVQNTENYTLTRSLANENSPYYMSGVKFSYKSNNENLNLDLVLLNGWQNMREQPENSNKAFGVRLDYKLNNKWTINYANFYGNEMPDTVKQNRFFNNFYAEYDPNERWDVLIGIDYGMQDNLNGASPSTWMVPTLIGRYKMKSKWYLTGRVEWFDDQDEVVASNLGPASVYSVFGTSVGLDYKPKNNVRFGVEGRYLDGWDVGGDARRFTFIARDGVRYSQTTLTFLMAVAF